MRRSTAVTVVVVIALATMSGVAVAHESSVYPNDNPETLQQPAEQNISFNSTQANMKAGNLDGAGTINNPYRITNVSELQAIDDDPNAHYQIANNINASDTAQWNNGTGFQPIGGPHGQSTSDSFDGSINGNGYTISHLIINRTNASTANIGVFSTNTGNISNISFSSLSVTGNASAVGGLVGGNDGGTIHNARISGNVTGGNNTGGLAGVNLDGTVRDVSVSGNVTGLNSAGGLLAYNSQGTITNVTATSEVEGNTQVGGAIGESSGGQVSDVVAYGDVTGTNSVGGLVGRSSGTIINATATGNVDGRVSVGGLVGYNVEGKIKKSTAGGDITGIAVVGGLVGDNEVALTNVTASGNVTGVDAVGGLAGTNTGPITDVNTSGVVAADNIAGGLVGFNSEASITNASSSAVVNVDQVGRVGGLVGYNSGGQISHATTSGKVNGIGDVGGLVGLNQGLIADTTSSANVTGDSIEVVTSYAGGLVGNNSGGIIKDSKASNDVVSIDPVGGLVGVSSGRIINVTASGDVTSNDDDAGGLVGVATGGSIVNSTASGNVTSGGRGGGSVGFAGGRVQITNAVASGDVKSDASSGGLVGENDAGLLTNVTAHGDVTGSSSVAGLVGSNGDRFINGTLYQGQIRDAVATGNATGDFRVGGLVGTNDGLVTNATAFGDATGDPVTGSLVGGLVGINQGGRIVRASASGDVAADFRVGGLIGTNTRGIVRNVSSSGDVTGNELVGGLIGQNYVPIQDAFATGDVTGVESVGGLVGGNPENGTVTDGYWDKTTTGQSESAGSATGLITSQMQGQAVKTSMEGLDFENTWTATESYPVLEALPQSPEQGVREYNLSIVTQSDTTYRPDKPVTISTTYNATGLIERRGDATIMIINATRGNGTVVGFNAGAPLAGGVNTTIPAGAISGDVTIEVQLYDESRTEVVATDRVNLTMSASGAPPDITGNGNAPTDPDGDGVYEDVNGDGEVSIFDVQALYSNIDDSTVQNNPSQFDINGDGEVSIFDVQTLFTDVTG